MKILLAVDDSPCSERAAKEIATRPWPETSEVKIITVVNPAARIPAAYKEEFERELDDEADRLLDKMVGIVKDGRTPDLTVTSEVLKGSPSYVIVDQANAWGADLIVVGSHGPKSPKRFHLGSVSHAIALYAECGVQIVRCRE